MATYKVEAPDGSIIELEGPENATDAQIGQAAQAAYAQRQTFNVQTGAGQNVAVDVRFPGGQQQAQTEPSTTVTGLAGAATRGLALPAAGAALGAMAGAPFAGVGAIPGAIAGAGAATLAQVVGDPIVSSINSLLGTKYTMPTQAMEDLLTRIGVAEPKTAAERIVQTTVAGAGVAGGTVAAGRAIQAAAGQAAPVTREVGRLLATQPALQVAGGAGAGAAGQTAKEMGAGPVGQIAATVAGAMAPLGVTAAIPAVRQAVRGTQTRTAAPAARIEPTLEPMPAPAAPTAPAGAPIGTAMAPEAAPVAQVATEAFEEVGDLVRKASGSGPGSAAAKAKLADVAQVNPDARAAAERLGMDLPFDVFSDNPQVRAAVGLTRSVAGGEAEAAWVNTVRTAIGKADDVVQQFDAAFIEGRPAPGATSQRILDSLNSTRTQLFNDADVIYKRVDATIPKTSTVQFPRLTQTLDDVLAEVGEKGLSAQEKKLYELATDPEVTYGRLLREKNLIGQAMAGKESPYGNMAAGDLKRLYGALAEDQLTNVGQIGGDALRQELRAANLLTAKRKALENRIVGAFGKESDGSVATLMQSAIKSAAKGDAAQFNKLIKVVPPELRKETIATAMASVASSGRAAQEGAFGFAEFAKTYRGLRANPPVYKQVIEVLGKDADPVLRDLFEISRRITDARAQVLTTGKANQALVEAMKAEGLIGKVMQSTTAQRVVTGAASAIPGGGFVAPDIVQFMSKGNADAVKAAGKLFASDDFQKLAIEAATKTEPSQAVLRRTAASKAFADFANAAKLPQSLDARVQWLQSAVQTGRQFSQENQ
jgi:hypothetical protein